MEPSTVATLMEHAVLTVFYMSMPMLLVGLAIGVFVSILQAVTQINEVTLVFIPKMLGVGLAGWVAGPWIYNRLHMFLMEVMSTVTRVGMGG